MPPRRTRTQLPTPANSVKQENSVSPSTSISGQKSETKIKIENGLRTPASLTDGEGGSDDDEDVKDVKKDRKRKAPSDDSTFTAPHDFTKPEPKYRLVSVTIPSKRSKLGTDKTTSLDNLTLGSPVSKTQKMEEDIDEKMEVEERKISPDALDLISPQPVVPRSKRPAKSVTRPAKQPFNIGINRNIKKIDSSTLELDDEKASSENEETTVPSTKGKGKGKAPARPRTSKAKIVDPDEEEAVDNDANGEDDDFAENSEEEADQLIKAIKASKASSRAAAGGSSSKATKKGKGKATPTGRGTGKARNAALSSAEKRRALAQAEAGSSTDDSGSAFSEAISSGSSSLSAESESELSFSGSDSDSGIPTPTGRMSTTKKALAKQATKRRFAGKGNKLGNGADTPGTPGTPGTTGTYDDEELASDLGTPNGGTGGGSMTIKELKRKNRETRKEAAELDKPRKEKEKALKKKLGRKLTQGEKNGIALSMHHPELEDVWGDLAATITPVKPVPMEAHPSLKLTLLPFQKESLYWMKKQEEGPWKGGMLADEMGMGKTIQTIALLLSEPRNKPSLVVAPVVALMQWKHEIETHAEGFTVCLWHGSGRMKAEQLKKYDVVLVSYGTLEASFRRQQRGFKKGNLFIKEKSPMHEFKWWRVVLDEAHNIKERSTNAAKAAFALQAEYKWCLSGTPLQNRVGELYSLVRFLGADPFSYYFCKRCDCKSLHWQFTNRRNCDTCGCSPMQHVCLWNTEILTPIAKYGIVEGGPGQIAFKKLKILLDRMMLRRTKLERADDLGLPPRTIVVRRDFFSPQEKELYMSLFTNAKRTFNTYLDSGTVLNNYSNIFSLITRMRQMACHPDLVLRSKTSTYVKDINDEAVCRLCNDAAEDAIVSACKHVFDRECIRQYLEVQQTRGHRPECPVCHIEISIDLEAEAIELDESNKKARQGILSRLNLDNWRSSSKLEALVEELEKLRNQDCTIKSLVFSQFVSFLDLIAFRLQRAGFVICRLEGGMTPQQRDATIQHFMNNTHVTVFLISLKAGGVALNLTEASRVYMMDSWWNPSVEYQAMDRIHRLGQKRPVTVVKIVIEDSIEDQIVQLQHKKLAMTEAALSSDPDAALGKLTVEDLGFLFKL